MSQNILTHVRLEEIVRQEEKYFDALAIKLIKSFPALTAPSTARALRDLLIQVKHAKLLRSGFSLHSENWEMPKDLPDWKGTKKKMRKLFIHLDEASNIIDDDHISCVLSRYDYNENLPELVVKLEELRQIAGKLSAVKGAKGNRPSAHWQKTAALYVSDFWRTYIEEPKPYFIEGTGKSGNDFTKFACAVLQCVHIEITDSMCQTILKPRSRN